MKPEIDKMLQVWDNVYGHVMQSEARNRRQLPANINFHEIISSVFTMGPSYYYIVDFFDMSVFDISPGFEAAHGMEPEQIKSIHDILSLVHPDDMDFVVKAEEKAHQFIDQKGIEKVTRYKVSYNFRFKAADGNYRLFNHQSLVLIVDEQHNFIRSINIHTDITHITNKNNYKWSAIGLAGERSYFNLDVWDDGEPASLEKSFSKRELEVLGLITEGYSTREIADKLFISDDTVKVHRKHILKKSGCANVAELAARSISEGWI